MLNQFTLIGRIAREPQLQTTREGISYTRFTLAVRKAYRNQSGNYDTDFVQLISWSKVAERVADYCTKGSLISVNGRLQMRSFEMKNQQRITIPDIIAEQVTFLHMKKPDRPSSHEHAHIPQPPSEPAHSPDSLSKNSNETKIKEPALPDNQILQTDNPPRASTVKDTSSHHQEAPSKPVSHSLSQSHSV